MAERNYQTIEVSESEGIAHWTLNQPERGNPLDPVMVNELLWALEDVTRDDAVRMVVLTGAGSAFCAGADLQQVVDTPAGDQPLPAKGDYGDLLLRLGSLDRPTLARVQGPALGGGLGLVASCDLAVAATSATFGTPEVTRGLWPMQIMAVLDRVMPRRKLVEMMLLGQTLSAEEALESGLVTRVVPDTQLDAEVRMLAQRLSDLPRNSVRAGLSAFRQQQDMSLTEAMPFLREQLTDILGSEDAMEGLRAFVEEREPHWGN